MGQWDRLHVLEPEQIKVYAERTPGWETNEDYLRRAFEFTNFVEAFSFMTEVAAISEELDHHPDWSNSWNKVDITVTNHQAGGITEIDFVLCEMINGLVAQ